MSSLELSSRWTWAYKFVVPAFGGGIFGFMTLVLFKDPSAVHWKGGGEPFVGVKWFFLGVLILGGFAFARLCIPLKTVFLEGSSLRISNYFRDAVVPVDQVRECRFDSNAWVGSRWNRRQIVKIEFRSMTPFGRSVEFIPRSGDAVWALRSALGQKEPGPEPYSEAREDAEEFRGRGTV